MDGTLYLVVAFIVGSLALTGVTAVWYRRKWVPTEDKTESVRYTNIMPVKNNIFPKTKIKTDI